MESIASTSRSLHQDMTTLKRISSWSSLRNLPQITPLAEAARVLWVELSLATKPELLPLQQHTGSVHTLINAGTLCVRGSSEVGLSDVPKSVLNTAVGFGETQP